ncbi:MAG TPA: GntR family transcriptional regulator, partial [Gaiellaceae bacterium]
MVAEDVLPHLRGLGFSDADAATLADHFLDAERRGKRGHGLTRVEWLGTLPDLRPAAKPRLVSARPGMRVWEREGTRLAPERELAEQFGVSRVTVRDALRALEAMGLVEVKVGA